MGPMILLYPDHILESTADELQLQGGLAVRRAEGPAYVRLTSG